MQVTKFSRKIYFFIGTTAELIKLAPVIRELERKKINFKIITSGQTNVNFEELAFLIEKRGPDIALGEKTNRSSVFLFFLWSIITFFRAQSLKKEFAGLNRGNSYFIVHGDPVSSLIGALIAKFYNLRLVHVESGLRSFNFLEPFPEELCRFLISKLADIHFCPNTWSLNNLSAAGIKINTNQNTLIESCLSALSNKNKSRDALRLPDRKYFVLVIHRQEHVIWGKKESKKMIEYILRHVDKKLLCIFVRHATTLNFLKSVNFKLSSKEEKRVRFVSRLRYLDFVNLMDKSEFLFTDGGSNQEEAYYMGLPCFLLRKSTERIEGLGENVVLGKNKRFIKLFLKNYKNYRRNRVCIKTRPSKIIVNYLLNN